MNYDTRKEVSQEGNFLYLSDDISPIKGWKIQKIDISLPDVKQARYWKINSHLLDSEYTIWVDASFHIDGPIQELVEGVKGMACYPHGTVWLSNKTAYEEAEVCKEAGLDDPRIINKQVARYRKEGFPDKPLFSTGILVRKNTPEIKRFNEIWWDEVKRGSYRDQISQTYAAWKTGVDIERIEEGDVYKNNYVTKTKHVKYQ